MENESISLNQEQREKLTKFAETGEHSAKLIKRAKVILALDRKNKVRTLRINEICKSNNISREALSNIRQDFLAAESVEAFLQRKKRQAWYRIVNRENDNRTSRCKNNCGKQT